MQWLSWFRKNWIDALMVTLILAGVGGFLALLLRGAGLIGTTATNPTPPATVVGSSNPATQTDNPTTNTDANAANTTDTNTGTNTTDTNNTATATAETTTATNTDTTSTDNTQVVVTDPKPETVMATKPKTTNTKPNATQKPKEDAPIQIEVKKVTPPPAPKIATRNNTNNQNTTQQIAKSQTTPNPQTSTRNTNTKNNNTRTNTISSSRAEFLRSYRVAVGTYASIGRAGSVAIALRNQGYPARAFTTNNGNAVVVVGPYSREITAMNSLKKLNSTYPGALLYRPNGTRTRGTNNTTQNNSRTTIGTPATTTPTTPNATTNTQTATVVSATPVYLQVGAFKDLKSAQRLLSDLRNDGYRPTLRSRPDGYTRLLIGPFSGDALDTAKNNTRNKGLSPFVVYR